MIATNYNPTLTTSAVREIGGRSYRLGSFIAIAFGLLEIDIARKNIERLGNQGLQLSIVTIAKKIATKFQRHMMVRSVVSALTGIVV